MRLTRYGHVSHLVSYVFISADVWDQPETYAFSIFVKAFFCP